MVLKLLVNTASAYNAYTLNSTRVVLKLAYQGPYASEFSIPQ